MRAPRSVLATRCTAIALAALFVVVACSGEQADEVTNTTEPTGEDGTTAASDVDSTDVTSATDELTAASIPPVVAADADHPEAVAALTSIVPAGSRGVVAIDVGALLAGGSAADVEALLSGQGGDPAWAQMLSPVGRLAGDLDVSAIRSAVLAHTTDAAGLVLLATLRTGAADGVDSESSVDGVERRTLPGDVLVAGATPLVESVVATVVGAETRSTGPMEPFLGALDPDASLTFAYGLPALLADVAVDRSLRSASVVSGAFDVSDGSIGGTMVFHTRNAAEVVETYNRLDRNAIQGVGSATRPLLLGDPIAANLGRVIVDVPPMRLVPTPDEQRASRNLFKKLFVGMEAHDYAEEVADRDQGAWLDFLVRSEADPDPTAGSVYIRWEFRDQAAIDAFEANELPAGFRLAPTQFLETDDPAGEYFFALNLYNAGGGSIVSGTRAEWDVFVHPPEGADPNAGVRPRFSVVDVLAEDVSADSGNLLTLAEPLSHEIVDGRVVSDIGRFGPDGDEIPAFESSFPVPDPATAEVARFTREMAIGNDYIYWAHGVSDRVLYNATTFNHDAYFVDTDAMTFVDSTRWADYLKPEIKDAVYYVNTLEYVASPMTNLDSEYLDITPEWLANLVAFTTNGHQEGLMRKGVEQLFRGQGDALVGFDITNDTPATFFHFEIDDPAAMAAGIDGPDGLEIMPMTLFVDGPESHYLTLSVFEIDGAVEGTRAEWSVVTDDGTGRPQTTVIDLMTADVAFDPTTILNLPDVVRHELADGAVTTRLASPTISFEASFSTADVIDHNLSLDWIEAGDVVCTTNGICDRFYYDAETLDVPVHEPVAVEITEFTSPWSEFVSEKPGVVFYRDNAQEYVVGRWFDLDVPVDELPFSGLDDRTHEIIGSGTLVGRTSAVGDSTYTYAGDAIVEADQLSFALDQTIVNALGEGHIFTTGGFDLATGNGTQTVIDCQGPSLLCSDIEVGSTAFYTAQSLDASDPDAISWQVDVAVDLGGAFGIADSASTFTANRVG